MVFHVLVAQVLEHDMQRVRKNAALGPELRFQYPACLQKALELAGQPFDVGR